MVAERQEDLPQAEQGEAQAADPEAHQPLRQAGEVFAGDARVVDRPGQPGDLLGREPRDDDIEPDADETDDDGRAGGGHPARVAAERRGEEDDRDGEADPQLDSPEDPPVGAAQGELETADVVGDVAVEPHQDLGGLEERIEKEEAEDHPTEAQDHLPVGPPALLEDGAGDRQQRATRGERRDKEDERVEPRMPVGPRGEDAEEGADAAVEHDRQRHTDRRHDPDDPHVANEARVRAVPGAQAQDRRERPPPAGQRPRHGQVAAHQEPELDDEENEVGGVEPDHPGHRGEEVRVDEDVDEPLHVADVHPDREEGQQERHDGGEDGQPADRLKARHPEDVDKRGEEEGAGREADEVDVLGDPEAPRHDRAVGRLLVPRREAYVGRDRQRDKPQEADDPERALERHRLLPQGR